MHDLRWAHGLGPALLAWCAGVALQLQQPALWPAEAYAALAALAVLVHWLRRWLGVVPLIRVCLACALLSFACTGGHALWKSPGMDPALEGQDLDLVGVCLLYTSPSPRD